MRRIAIGIGVVLVVVSIVGGNPLGHVQQAQVVFQRVQSVKFQGSSQQDQRAVIYRQTPRMIRDHWLTGVGANNFAEVAPQYGLVEPFNGDTFAHAHNIALTIGAEFGVPGLIALLWLTIAIALQVPRAVARSAGSARGLGIAVVAALVALALQGLVDYTLSSNVISTITALLLAALVVLARAAKRTVQPEGQSAAPGRPLLEPR
jgi:O-antigen ligase